MTDEKIRALLARAREAFFAAADNAYGPSGNIDAKIATMLIPEMWRAIEQLMAERDEARQAESCGR